MSLAMRAARSQVAGDPGFFGDIGKFVGGVVKTVGGIAPGPIGGVLEAVGGGIQRISGGGAPSQVPAVRRGRTAGGVRRTSFASGGRIARGAPAPAPAQRALMAGPGLACPSGFRPNKSDYFLKSGAFVAEGTRCVRVRRRNPLNVRAADRAIGRLESAKKAASRLNRITVRPKKCPK